MLFSGICALVFKDFGALVSWKQILLIPCLLLVYISPISIFYFLKPFITYFLNRTLLLATLDSTKLCSSYSSFCIILNLNIAFRISICTSQDSLLIVRH